MTKYARDEFDRVPETSTRQGVHRAVADPPPPPAWAHPGCRRGSPGHRPRGVPDPAEAWFRLRPGIRGVTAEARRPPHRPPRLQPAAERSPPARHPSAGPAKRPARAPLRLRPAAATPTRRRRRRRQDPAGNRLQRDHHGRARRPRRRHRHRPPAGHSARWATGAARRQQTSVIFYSGERRRATPRPWACSLASRRWWSRPIQDAARRRPGPGLPVVPSGYA